MSKCSFQVIKQMVGPRFYLLHEKQQQITFTTLIGSENMPFCADVSVVNCLVI